MFGRTPDTPPPFITPVTGGNLPPNPPAGPPSPPVGPPNPFNMPPPPPSRPPHVPTPPPGPDWRDRLSEMTENAGLQRQVATRALGRAVLGTRARRNERKEDKQEDRILLLGRVALGDRLLGYEPADEIAGTPARITGNRRPDKEGILHDLRSGLLAERRTSAGTGEANRRLGPGVRLKTQIMARRINRAARTQAKASRANRESHHGSLRPYSRLRFFKGYGQREGRKMIRDSLHAGHITSGDARIRLQYLTDGRHANTSTTVRDFRQELSHSNLETHKGSRYGNRMSRKNRPLMGLRRRTRQLYLGDRYNNKADRAEARQDRAADRADALRRRVDASYRESARVRAELAARRGTTVTRRRPRVHGHAINPRQR